MERLEKPKLLKSLMPWSMLPAPNGTDKQI